mgnify:FL=1
MGLGAVELVMEIEESFDIDLSNDEAERIETVGDLYHAILVKTGQRAGDTDRCLTAATFYELRRALQSRLEIDEGVQPKTRLDEFLPRRGRRSAWRALSREMDLRFPKLQRPSWLVVLGCLGVTVATIGTYLRFSPAIGSGASGIVALLALVFSTATAVTITRPFALETDESFQTIRGLVQTLVAMNYAKLSARHQSQRPTDVWNVLQWIVAEQLGVDKERVTPEASLVYDLGLD